MTTEQFAQKVIADIANERHNVTVTLPLELLNRMTEHNSWEFGWDAIVGIGTLILAGFTYLLFRETSKSSKQNARQEQQKNDFSTRGIRRNIFDILNVLESQMDSDSFDFENFARLIANLDALTNESEFNIFLTEQQYSVLEQLNIWIKRSLTVINAVLIARSEEFSKTDISQKGRDEITAKVNQVLLEEGNNIANTTRLSAQYLNDFILDMRANGVYQHLHSKLTKNEIEES